VKPTQKDYVRNVRNFTAFLGRSPDTATSDDLRRFQLQMAIGHAKLETMALYTLVAVNTVRDIRSPPERLEVNLASRSPPA
jgi:hypothetical protein